MAEARGLLRDLLGDLLGDVPDDWPDRAQVCVSELVTNAVVHAGTTVDVRVHLYPGGLRVEVVDLSPHRPLPRQYASLASTGRGLMMVDRISDRWGVVSTEDGKTVWFELGLPSDPGFAPEASVVASPDAVPVELRNMPLLLHSAWRMHAESLLREHLLSQLDDESLAGLEAHAAASEAMSVLQEQVPVPDVGEDPREIMAAATEPHVSMELLRIEVPTTSVGNFETLDLLLESAVSLADAGHLMTPGTQPEIRAFRRWLCGQVTRQARGGPAAAWDPDLPVSTGARSGPVEWDPEPVTGAGTAVLAADDENRIVAASPAALALLRYDSADDLVGRRLVDIVPFRFRQAHLAGFTLHAFAGRSALIGVTVSVPALCADGAEVDVQLTVRSKPLPGGRHVFEADLTATDATGRQTARSRPSQ